MKKLAFWFLFIVLVPTVQAQTYGVTNQTGRPVYTYSQLIDEAAIGAWRRAVPGSRIASSEVPLLQQRPFSGFHRESRHRALALGYPAVCPYSVRAVGYSSPELAAAQALEQCLIRVAQFDGYQREDCGCRIAIVDDVIYGDPEEVLALPEVVPAYIQVGNRRTLGLLYHSGIRGRDLAVTFKDVRGRQRCAGTYSIGALVVNNSFQLSCDLFEGQLSGTIGIRDWRSFNTWVRYEGESMGSHQVLITIGRHLGQP